MDRIFPFSSPEARINPTRMNRSLFRCISFRAGSDVMLNPSSNNTTRDENHKRKRKKKKKKYFLV